MAKWLCILAITIQCLNLAHADEADEAIYKKKVTNLQLPKVATPEKDAIFAEKLNTRLRVMDQNMDMGNFCATISEPGKAAVPPCNPKKPKALILFDPEMAQKTDRSGIKSTRTYSRNPNADCLIAKTELELKGYCVEGYSISSPDELENLGAEFAAKYKYVYNITHGLPGKIFAPSSSCENVVISECLKNNRGQKKVADCVAVASGESTEPIATACPCHKENAEMMRVGGLMAQTPPAKIPDKLSQDSTLALLQWNECAKAHPNNYSRELDPSHISKLLSEGGQFYSISCATAATKEGEKEYTQRVCSTAPKNFTFNVSLSLNMAPNFFPLPLVQSCGINCAIEMCAENGCTTAELPKYLAAVKSLKTNFYEKFPSSFECYTCQGTVPVKLADCKGLFTPTTNNMTYDKLPPELKDKTNHALEEQKKKPKLAPPPNTQ